jgi:hypothetical protein
MLVVRYSGKRNELHRRGKDPWSRGYMGRYSFN